MRSNLHQLTTKIVSLSKSGFITTARKLFDEMPHKDSITWNAMLSSYSQLGLHTDALSLFHLMRYTNTKPDHFTFTSTLNACSGLGSFRNGTKVHGLIIAFGYQCYLPVNNSIIDMYGKCLDPYSARKAFEEMGESIRNEVTWCSLLYAYANSGQFNIAFETFYEMPKRVLVAWNIMITGFAQNGEVEMCIQLLKEMRESLCCFPDEWTFSSLMNACTESSDYAYGCTVHGFIIKIGWSSAMEVKNSILSFYAKLCCMDVAIKEFESVGLLSQVSWNAMIDGYIKMGNTIDAFNVFQRAPMKNVISWTSMIAGYARNGEGEQALNLFVQMVRSCICPDEFTFGAILHACSSLAVLGFGKMVHGCVIRYGFQAYVYVGNGLVNMYAKCGDIKRSSYAFNEILEKDLVSWNAMLFGFGMHGLSTQALQIYDEMVAHGMKPDKVSFIGLLMTCSHAGLINKGRLFFDMMSSLYGLTYEIDHVACMVDMLGRAGYLVEAKELSSKYSKKDTVEAKSSSYEALLGACSIHGDVRMGVSVRDDLQHSVDSQKDMGYVLLSNLYCASGQWKEAEIVRKAMVDQGVKKMPGYSWIEVKNKVTVFVAGNISHPYREELYMILNSLDPEMRNPCFSSFEI
ncbi:hypothetical protein ERO13_A09G061400v2 [Gossypium hirsutum]|uniref:Pentatricopeptide repeat-containing protein At2g36980, mitochondrial n=1 Tax=Gossypium hirsutum TaxID=3635 RepID=A0A1U8HRK6_GOSHI|nr:pentatricopeptide repeat-containing protein At2g36980, mitochondrial-like [Gossypium hirsutum]KAG4182704.1 hypothetical protein ERO13_A09G061400v2 [Gossypium hirsutum]